jgi:hypothetical protein
MIEKDRGFELEFNIPWNTLIAESTKNELVTEEIPIVAEAKMITMPRKSFLLTLSEILPATRPKKE